MEQTEFKKLLYRAAFCAMACDGVIDEREVEELRRMDTDTAYFSDVDLSRELDASVQGIRETGRRFIGGFLATIRGADLSWVQEMLLLEVALRVISADEKVEPVEVHFLKSMRSRLAVPDEVLLDRFGKLPTFEGVSKANLRQVKDFEFHVDDEIAQLPELTQLDLDKLQPEG